MNPLKQFKAWRQKHKSRYDTAINNWFSTSVEKVKSATRFPDRIAKANQWAAQHPKRFFQYAMMSFLGILLLTILNISVFSEKQTPSMKFNNVTEEISNVSSLIEGFQSREEKRREMKSLYIDLRESIGQIKHEIDSISQKGNLSPRDSIEIARRVRQLKAIHNTISTL